LRTLVEWRRGWVNTNSEPLSYQDREAIKVAWAVVDERRPR
jgi:hypothetical protein